MRTEYLHFIYGIIREYFTPYNIEWLLQCITIVTRLIIRERYNSYSLKSFTILKMECTSKTKNHKKRLSKIKTIHHMSVLIFRFIIFYLLTFFRETKIGEQHIVVFKRYMSITCNKQRTHRNISVKYTYFSLLLIYNYINEKVSSTLHIKT